MRSAAHNSQQARARTNTPPTSPACSHPHRPHPAIIMVAAAARTTPLHRVRRHCWFSGLTSWLPTIVVSIQQAHTSLAEVVPAEPLIRIQTTLLLPTKYKAARCYNHQALRPPHYKSDLLGCSHSLRGPSHNPATPSHSSWQLPKTSAAPCCTLRCCTLLHPTL